MTKAAIIQLTKTMAVSLAPAVRVNCYCPGTIDTEMGRNTAAAGTSDPRVANMTAANLIRRKGTPGRSRQARLLPRLGGCRFHDRIGLPHRRRNPGLAGVHE